MPSVHVSEGPFSVHVKTTRKEKPLLGDCQTKLLLDKQEECRFLGTANKRSVDRAKENCQRVLASGSAGEESVRLQYETYLRLLERAQQQLGA